MTNVVESMMLTQEADAAEDRVVEERPIFIAILHGDGAGLEVEEVRAFRPKRVNECITTKLVGELWCCNTRFYRTVVVCLHERGGELSSVMDYGFLGFGFTKAAAVRGLAALYEAAGHRMHGVATNNMAIARSLEKKASGMGEICTNSDSPILLHADARVFADKAEADDHFCRESVK